jgi:hypothetical protein
MRSSHCKLQFKLLGRYFNFDHRIHLTLFNLNLTSLRTDHFVSGITQRSILDENLSGWTKHFGIYLYKHQQMHQNYHFVVMLSQMHLHVSAYQRRHQGAHTILTSYFSV